MWKNDWTCGGFARSREGCETFVVENQFVCEKIKSNKDIIGKSYLLTTQLEGT